MIELAKNFVQEHEELLPLVVFLMVIAFTINFFQKNNGFLKSIGKTDYDKRISSLASSLQHLGPKNELLRSLIQHQINDAIFSNTTGYIYNKERQENFLKFYDLLKGSVGLTKIKYLYNNTQIIDGVIRIKNTKGTNLDIYFKLILGIFVLMISFILTFFLFSFSNDNPIISLLFAFVYVSMILFGIISVSISISDKRFLKKMREKYDGWQLLL